MEQPDPSPAGPESLYAAVTRWAGHAPRALLTLLGLAGGLGGPAVLLVDWHFWPFSGLALAAGSTGLWGLIDQRATLPHTRRVTAAERLLTAVGLLSAMLGAVGLLFWSLGDAPNF
jgi:hypothetical protein